jgi:hypothetical protein
MAELDPRAVRVHGGEAIVRISRAARSIGSIAGDARGRNRSGNWGKSRRSPEGVVDIRFVDPALEAGENVSKNRFAFGSFVFSCGIGL